MRRITSLLLSTLLATAIMAGCSTAKPAEAPKTEAPKAAAPAKLLQVGLTQIVEHPSLDTVRKGIIDGLKEAGFEDGKQLKIDFQSAQGEMPIAQQIAQKFVADKKDIIIALATPSAMAAAKATTEIPVIFGTVTDPVGAGLVKSLEKPGTNVTGTSDMTPVKEQLSLFAKLGTKVKSVGMIYNAGEANARPPHRTGLAEPAGRYRPQPYDRGEPLPRPHPGPPARAGLGGLPGPPSALP